MRAFHALCQTALAHSATHKACFASASNAVVSDSSVGTVSHSQLAGRSEDRIPVRARFSAPVQTGPGAHPASYTGSFPGVKRSGRGVDHPPLSSAEVKERVELYIYSPSGTSWPVAGRALPSPYRTRCRPQYVAPNTAATSRLRAYVEPGSSARR